MQRYIARRLIVAMFLLFVLSIVVFLLLRIAPGDAALYKCPPPCPEAQLDALRERLGLRDPYIVQYGTWAKGLVTGSLGTSNEGLVIFPEIKRRMPITAELLLITMIVTIALGIPFGVISA